MALEGNEIETPEDDRPQPHVPPLVVALAGWALPGGGFLLIHQRARGITIMAAVLTLYIFGLLIAGVRVIDVPGYDKNGYEVHVDSQGRRTELGDRLYPEGSWAMTSGQFVSEIAGKPWYVGQILAGPANLLASAASLHEARNHIPMTHARLAEIGTLYTAVAGMLNLLAIIDAAHRAAQGQFGEPEELDPESERSELQTAPQEPRT